MIYLAAVCAAVCVAQAAVLVLLLVLVHRERQDIARERADLLRRIQAPQLALVEDQPLVPTSAPPAVSEFDDDDYWISREALAERLGEAELKGANSDE